MNQKLLEILNGVRDALPSQNFEADESAVVIVADDALQNVRAYAESSRYGNYLVKFQSLNFYCHDLLSFYMACKDIFLQKIYDFESNNIQPMVIDGGGHIGLFTLYVKRKYPNAKVLVFELDPESLMLLRKNLDANDISGVEIVEAGLGREDGWLPFHSDHSDGSSFFSNTPATGQGRVTRLSPHLNRNVDFLKLNIEGAELDVLEESAGFLGHVNEMVIEYHGFPEIGQRLHALLAILDSCGFRYLIHDFDTETNGATKPPFRISRDGRFFLLIYAKQLGLPVFASHVSSDDVCRTEPICRKFGLSRGKPVDRYYIEKFLKEHRSCITGRVLEVGDSSYSRQFGTNIASFDVLNTVVGDGTTVVGDLGTGHGIPAEVFDCIIMTQTVQFVFDIQQALKSAYGALKPGGTLLVTVSGISQISRYDMDRWGEYWRLTDRCLRRLLEEVAPVAQMAIRSHGNFAAARAFLDGRAVEELPQEVLDHQDNDYQVLLTASVTKPGQVLQMRSTSASQLNIPEPIVLIYHRVAEDLIDSQLLAVTPRHFEQQLEVLSEHCRVLDLEELLDEAGRGIFRPNTVAITFDDGYSDNFIQALPILERHKLPATFFVVSGMVGRDREFWWDALERILFTGQSLPAYLEIFVGEQPMRLAMSTAADRFQAYEFLCNSCRTIAPEMLVEIINQLCQWAGLSACARLSHRPVTAAELAEFAKSPLVEIGSHTVDHAFLATLSLDQQRFQLAASKQQLENFIRKAVRFISYPWGSPETFSSDTVAIAGEVGYQAGIANIQDTVHLPFNKFAVPRLLVRNWCGDDFRHWLCGDPEERMKFERLALETRMRRLSDGA